MHYIREQEKEDWGHLAGRGGFMKKTHGPRKDVGSRYNKVKGPEHGSAKAIINWKIIASTTEDEASLCIGGDTEIITQMPSPRISEKPCLKNKTENYRRCLLSSSTLHTYISTPTHTSKHHIQKDIFNVVQRVLLGLKRTEFFPF